MNFRKVGPVSHYERVNGTCTNYFSKGWTTNGTWGSVHSIFETLEHMRHYHNYNRVNEVKVKEFSKGRTSCGPTFRKFSSRCLFG